MVSQLRLMSASWSNFELQPSLARDCAEERTQHCPTVLPGMSRIYNCLIAKADSVRDPSGALPQTITYTSSILLKPR